MQSEMDMNLDSRKLMKGVTLNLTLTHTKELRLRVWIAMQIFAFAAWIGGFGSIEVEE